MIGLGPSISTATERVTGWIHRWPVSSRFLTALHRANGLRFTRWAAAIALFAYLSVFPLVVLAGWILSVVLENFPDVRHAAEDALTQALTVDGLISSDQTIDLNHVVHQMANAGLIGAVLLAITGLGWIDASIEGIRRMYGITRRPRSWLLLRVEDFLWLLVVGVALLAAIALAVGVRSLGQWVFEQLDWQGYTGSAVRTGGSVLSAVLVWLVLACFYAFSWRRPTRRWRAVVIGSFLATVGIWLMVDFASIVVGRTLSNPVYGALAVAAAILLLLYFASILVLYFASWIAVCEGAAMPAEVVTYQARLSSQDVQLPTTAVEGSVAADDDAGRQ